MSVDLITITALSSSVAELANQVYPALREYLEKRKQGQLTLKIGGQEIEIAGSKEVPPGMIEALRKYVESSKETSGDTLTLSRRAVLKLSHEETEQRLIDSAPPPEVSAMLLAISPDAVFRDARKRIDLVFKLNLGLAIVLAVILLGGITGAVISAVFFEKAIWALVFGSISVGDVIGAYALKPLTAINAAVIATQRLETIHLRLSEQLKVCAEHANLEDRIRCQTMVWETIQKDLSTLAGI